MVYLYSLLPDNFEFHKYHWVSNYTSCMHSLKHFDSPNHYSICIESHAYLFKCCSPIQIYWCPSLFATFSWAITSCQWMHLDSMISKHEHKACYMRADQLQSTVNIMQSITCAILCVEKYVFTSGPQFLSQYTVYDTDWILDAFSNQYML